MSFLNVQNIGTDRQPSLVVDSRLISEVLGVGHGDWIRNVVKKYKSEIEDDFGEVRFENGKLGEEGRPTIYALLTEDQATCLMTYSKNTEQVRAAKRNLVKSFSKAKELILQGVRIDPEPLKLAPPIERIASLKSSLEFFGIDAENPRFKQELQDLTLDVLGIKKATSLPGGEDVWCGVAERSEQLGIPVGLVTRYRSVLGKSVKSMVPDADRKEEARLCNGTQRSINLYRVTEELDAAILDYFEKKAVAS
jgi:phage regulator Rha-like protein